MSEIPEDVVARVARAIYGVVQGDKTLGFPTWEMLHDDEKSDYRNEARAALKASGWAEMREALMHQVERTLPDGTPCFCSHPPGYGVDHFNWCHEARAALRKARGET